MGSRIKRLIDKMHSKAPMVYEITLSVLILTPMIALLIYLITNSSWSSL